MSTEAAQRLVLEAAVALEAADEALSKTEVMSLLPSAKRRALIRKLRSYAAVNLDPGFEAFATDVEANLVPKIEGSAMTISVCPVEGKLDVKFAVELGASIMLDKPIIVAVTPGRRMPERLARVADEIVEMTAADDETSGRLAEAIERVAARMADE